MRLEHLAHLRLTNCDGLTLNFHEGVLPVLTLRGHGLVSLLLANFTVVDLVGELSQLCSISDSLLIFLFI